MLWKLNQILKRGGGGILLEDDSLIAINKPAGLLVLPDRFDRNQINLYNLLREVFEKIYIVHRIDKDTSGIVLFAKTTESHSLLNRAFENREVVKIYQAIVGGNPVVSSGSIELPIAEDGRGRSIIAMGRRNGKEAITRYEIKERLGKYTLIEAKPHTGRTHQIRIHLSAIGMPILGDPIYGDGKGFYLSSIKNRYREKGEEQPLISRTALHAHSISFIHPLFNRKILIEAPLAKDMTTVLKALRKYCGHLIDLRQ